MTQNKLTLFLFIIIAVGIAIASCPFLSEQQTSAEQVSWEPRPPLFTETATGNAPLQSPGATVS